jgi:transcriptional regulator with XRE-family HTH domain
MALTWGFAVLLSPASGAEQRFRGYAHAANDRPHTPDAAEVRLSFGSGRCRPVISPYVRRLRLIRELIRLREDHGYSANKLAEAIGVVRQRISRLENGHVRPDQDEIMRILDLFGVGEKRWAQIMRIAREAQERGWWEKFANEMGPRQALYANLEAGASSISEYQMTMLPGLLQIPAFTEVRARADRGVYSPEFDPMRALEARAARQRMVERPGGPSLGLSR